MSEGYWFFTLTLSDMGGAGPSMTWGGVNLTHSQEINKGVD